MNAADTNDLENRFTYHKPFGSQPQRYEALRAKAKELAALIIHSCPASREMSLALTKVEECVFWANASIARHEVESEGLRKACGIPALRDEPKCTCGPTGGCSDCVKETNPNA